MSDIIIKAPVGTSDDNVLAAARIAEDLRKQLSRMADADTCPDHRCSGCAFRADTEANRYGHTIVGATKAVMHGTPFHCHMKPELCDGWKRARRVDVLETAAWECTVLFE